MTFIDVTHLACPRCLLTPRSAPLLQGEDYEEDESRAQSDDDTDSYADRQNSVSPRQTRESRRSNSPPLLIHLNSSDKRGATADYGRDNNAVGGMGGGGRGRVVGIQRKVSVKIRRSVGSSRASSPEPSGEAVAHTASSPRDTHVRTVVDREIMCAQVVGVE